MTLQTEIDFVLPKGYVDEAGTLHRNGAMRLATAADEILPAKDMRVQSNPAYLAIILLSRVVTRLGEIKVVSPKVIEGLFSADFGYLQELYRKINDQADSVTKTTCPKCEHVFEVDAVPLDR
jgi:hypothetical protein